ncbi:hypothetical protein [Kocuria sp. cx-455]|uniref:hypothetical protein n=1 Tax=Kocuria sp. cx-455 TaxID=2771377 RepID=UPI003D72755A
MSADSAPNGYDGEGRKTGLWSEKDPHGALHGSWVWFRATGGLQPRGGILDDQKHGLWERWVADGSPLDATQWERGKKLRRAGPPASGS